MTSVTKQRLQKRSPAEGEPTSAKTAQMWGTGELLFAENLSRQPWLLHAFSTRSFGTLGYSGEGGADGEKNRARFLQALAGSSVAKLQLATLRQVHFDIIHRVASVPNERLTGDGMITDVAGIVLAVQTADCLPVLLADPKRKAVGAFHAGWRGTLARIVEKGVGAMRREFGSVPRDLLAAIGPGIHGCCYRVGEEVREQFASQFSYAAELFEEFDNADEVRRKYPLLFMNQRAPGHGESGPEIHLDLVKANLRQLTDVGVPEKNIEASPLCTVCRKDLLFSYRAEGAGTGRMMASVAIQA